MARDDWYRNKSWNDEIERTFFTKLERARSSKQQYLRIQASYLVESHPGVTLRLLDIYFAQRGDFSEALAYCHKAKAYLAQNDLTPALQSYEMALECEKKRPNVKTTAYLGFCLLITARALSNQYARCLELLDQHEAEPKFPVDHFLWHVTRALILNELGDNKLAKKDAELAIEAAKARHSGFRYHSTLGLVNDKYFDIQQKLKDIINS